MALGNEKPEEISENDILFECSHCGKSLAIDYRGAGLMIPCPACRQDIQVPIPEGVDIADLDRLGVMEVKDGNDEPFSATAMAIPKTPDQVRLLMTELEELRLRRRYLEQQRAGVLQGLQAMERQVAVMRATLEQIEDVLKHLRAPSPDETQDIT